MSTHGADGARRDIIISDREHGLPFSKGLMANAIMAAGISPGRAYKIARMIEDRLHDGDRSSVTTGELRRLTVDTIREEAGERYAEAYMKWQTVGALDIPLIILIGGGTGVGKSTLATQLAARLGIVRSMSTDAIREVMKSVVSREFLPTLYTSSFDTAGVMTGRLPKAEDAVILGFREQVQAVAAGVRALIDRAVTEGTDIIIEGAHVAPGYVRPEVGDRAVVVQLVVTVDDEDLHRSHFYVRAHETRARPVERYLQHFQEIRKIQKYIKSLALQHGVPIVPNHNLDSTLASVIEIVMNSAVEAARTRPAAAALRAEAAIQEARGGAR